MGAAWLEALQMGRGAGVVVVAIVGLAYAIATDKAVRGGVKALVWRR